MNKFSLALAALLGFAVLTPATAEAGGCRTRVTYDNGCSVHWEYRCVGRAYDGCPIYRWVVVHRSYPRVSFGYGGHYHGGHGHYHHGHRHYRGGHRRHRH